MICSSATPLAKHHWWKEFSWVSLVRQLALSGLWINLSQDFLSLPKGVRSSLRVECTAKLYYQSKVNGELEACQGYWQFQQYGVENEKGRKGEQQAAEKDMSRKRKQGSEGHR